MRLPRLSIGPKSLPAKLALAGAALLLAGGPALADAIDGDWCHAGLSLRIEGPKIRTPGGSQIEGRYARHDFSYVVPAAEPEAGAEIEMQLLSEETMSLARKNAAKPAETWRRCKPIS